MKLGLGTAQFGLDYGVANRSGRVPATEVARMLMLAEASGIRVLDTALQYGDSESVLGENLPAGTQLQVVTKSPQFGAQQLTDAHADELECALEASLRKLQRDRVYGLLLHHAPDALAPGSDRLFDRLQRLKQRGWVEKVGVSVYDPDQLENILDRHPIDLVQIPFNVLDQRLAHRPSLLARVRREGVELHVRSAFLQGLMLVERPRLDGYFKPWASRLSAFHERCREAGSSPLSVALRFALAAPFADRVIVGADSMLQLRGIIAAASDETPLPALQDLATDEPALINPGTWVLSTAPEALADR
jgi:aryl-alcohol dehydrogenase-like predicted oxidoreductase